jgi:hypothetical protein
MKLHCIIIPFNSLAKIALASGSKNTSIAARIHPHRSDLEVISDLSGSNLMIKKRLGHKRGDETPSYALSASSLRGTTTATTTEEALIQDDDDDDDDAKARENKVQ